MPSRLLAQGLSHLDPRVERRVEIAVPHSSTPLSRHRQPDLSRLIYQHFTKEHQGRLADDIDADVRHRHARVERRSRGNTLTGSRWVRRGRGPSVKTAPRSVVPPHAG
ncbi:hypothetical protein PUR28_31600 [Streptomyces sp. BE308]|uniref:hypothetical protein n=1 Tax=Streptomyces sp. BE308 TaxID=3002529 RepID=UPI002E77FA1F|nr:hypothetical protein [Streptomyces sp. BE308]MEE1795269.1 hypothetical protein [Streptomyces sp. BE308]